MHCVTSSFSDAIQYNTIQLYRLGVEGVQHIAKANNIYFFKGKCGLRNVGFHERIV